MKMVVTRVLNFKAKFRNGNFPWESKPDSVGTVMHDNGVTYELASARVINGMYRRTEIEYQATGQSRPEMLTGSYQKKTAGSVH